MVPAYCQVPNSIKPAFSDALHTDNPIVSSMKVLWRLCHFALWICEHFEGWTSACWSVSSQMFNFSTACIYLDVLMLECSSSQTFFSSSGELLSSMPIARPRRWVGRELDIFSFLLVLELTGTLFALHASSASTGLKLFFSGWSLPWPCGKQAALETKAVSMLYFSESLAQSSEDKFHSRSEAWWALLLHREALWIDPYWSIYQRSKGCLQ